jgi:hypothetical protein
VIAQLAERVPEFQPEDPDLPHVAFGQLVSFLDERLRATASAAASDPVLPRVVDFIEAAAASGDEKVTNLVMVSFLENMHILGLNCRRVRALLGPRTQRLADEYEKHFHEKVCPEPG